MEADSHGYRPDILLRKKDGQEVWLEIVVTTRPSDAKLKVCEEAGIDLFEVNGSNGPVGPDVLMGAHIASINCRKAMRDRLLVLWLLLSGGNDPVVGVKQDFRSVQRREREFREHWSEVAQIGEAVRSGEMVCSRCQGPLSDEDGNGVSIAYRSAHREDGTCGQFPFCHPCDQYLRVGDNWKEPPEAVLWDLDLSCARCVAIHQEQQREADQILGDAPRTLTMPWGPGFRIVSEPNRRTRSFVVGDGQGKTVGLREFQSLVFLPQNCLLTLAEWTNDFHNKGEITSGVRHGMLRDLAAAYKQFDRMLKLGWPANNFRDHDWIAGVGESFVSEKDEPTNDTGDCLLRIRLVMPRLRPHPFLRI